MTEKNAGNIGPVPGYLTEKFGVTQEDWENIIKSLRAAAAKMNRRPKVPCVCDECGGRIVKHVRSLFRGQYYFSQPACEKCGTSYGGAEKFEAIALGVEEFERLMRTPFF